MTTTRRTLLYAVIAGASLAGVLLLALTLYGTAESRPERTPDATTAAVSREHNVLRFAAGAPQLAYLHIASLEEIPEPASDALPARVAYDEDVTARVSSPIAGRVLRLLARPGDTIEAGQPLLELDAPEYGQALADLAKARAARELDEHAYARSRLLYDHGVLARRELESAQADLAQARAEEQRARGRIRNLVPFGNENGETGGRYILRAPIAGVLVDRQVNPGSEVRPDAPNPLFVITDPSRLWVLADLPERALDAAHAGQQTLIEVDAFADTRFRGRVAYIGTALDPNTRRIPVRITVDNRDGRLRPEMFARVTLLADTGKNVIRVPNTAIVTEGVSNFVFVEKAPGTLEKRAVRLEHQTADHSVVAEGITGGERIVTQGALLLSSELEGGGSGE